MPLLVKRNLLGELSHEVWPFRSRSDEAHLTFQDVPELRNLIDPDLANDAADARRTSVAFTGPNRSRCFSVNPHRAKLGQYKRAPVPADSFLLVKDRTFRLELDQNGRHQNDWQRENCANQCHQPVDHGARKLRDLRLPSTTRED